MKTKRPNNFPLKIMSLAVAILVWLIVVNVDNPVISKTYIISNVELINKQYIEDTDKVCMRDDEQTPVRVTIKAERKTLSRITAENIQAVADAQQAVSLETNPVMIPISVTCPGISQNNISVQPQNMSVRLEDRATAEFMVTVNSGEGMPGKGYEIGSQIVSPEKVRITGPKSMINKIDKVIANVDVNGITEDTTDTENLTIIDKNQEQLSEDSMKYIGMDNVKATVTTKLWKVRAGVKINVNYKGVPADGYVVDSAVTVPETVSVAGSEEALDELKVMGNTIWVQDEKSVDISGAKNDVEEKVNISELLSEGLKLTSGSSEEVWVNIRVLPEGGKIFTIPATKDSVRFKNKADNLQVSFEIDKMEVRVKAVDGDIEALSDDDIKASIDLSDKEEGSYEVPVKINLPKGYELIEDVKTEIKVSKVSTIAEEK